MNDLNNEVISIIRSSRNFLIQGGVESMSYIPAIWNTTSPKIESMQRSSSEQMELIERISSYIANINRGVTR